MIRFFIASLVLAFVAGSMLGCGSGEPTHAKIKGSHFKRLENGNKTSLGKPKSAVPR